MPLPDEAPPMFRLWWPVPVDNRRERKSPFEPYFDGDVTLTSLVYRHHNSAGYQRGAVARILDRAQRTAQELYGS